MAQKKTPPKKRSPGRPPTFREEFSELAYQQCLCGATDADLADFFEVSEKTINAWKKQHPHFGEALKKGKDLADGKVANALYLRAIGYTHPEEKIFCSDGEIVRAETIRQYPPDTPAAIFWLKNRQKARWRDKIDHEHGGSVGFSLKDVIERAENPTRMLPMERRTQP
jgi:hypothetical protein